MAYTQEPRQLKDYDVLGVGACRRERLMANSDAKILLTHSYLIPKSQRAVYETILAETLRWLKPQEVRENKLSEGISPSTEDYFLQVLLEDFQKEFPKTSIYLKQDLTEPEHSVVKAYLLEFPWQGPLLSEHFRYFPEFLRRKFHDAQLYLIAQKEWLWSYLSFADFGLPVPEEGRILVNPSLQSFSGEPEARSPGLFLYYYDYSRRKVREHRLDVGEAAVIDMLQEERKYKLDQLIEQVLILELETALSREEWRKKLLYLKSEGILLESGSRWNLDLK